jgi:hypothetical protein
LKNNFKKEKEEWGMASVVVCLLSQFEALSSNLNIANK